MSSNTTYHCDRCGAEINGKPFTVRRFFNFECNLYGNPNFTERISKQRDLCKNCNDLLKKFLDGEKLMCERLNEIEKTLSKQR